MPIANSLGQKNKKRIIFKWSAAWFSAKMHGTPLCQLEGAIISVRSCTKLYKCIFPWSENLYERVSLKSYRWIGDGIGRWKKSSSWQNSCNSICWRQQWQSFSLIWNRSYRKIKTGIRRELHTFEVKIKKRKRKEKVFTLHFSTLGTTIGYLTDQRWVPLVQHNHCSDITIAGIYHTTPMNTAKNRSPECVF